MSDLLQFLHKNVGVIRYYPDMPELSFSTSVIIDLLAATFTLDHTDPSLDELFTRKVIFPLDVFEKLANCQVD